VKAPAPLGIQPGSIPVPEAVDSSGNSSPLAKLMASCASALRKRLTQDRMELPLSPEAELLVMERATRLFSKDKVE
jgi:hypothetical protein